MPQAPEKRPPLLPAPTLTIIDGPLIFVLLPTLPVKFLNADDTELKFALRADPIALSDLLGRLAPQVNAKIIPLFLVPILTLKAELKEDPNALTLPR